MNKNEHGILPEDLRNRDWLKEIPSSMDEETVNVEFEPWLERLRHSRLAEKVRRMWVHFKSGKLSGFDKTVVIGALLYCLMPVDAIPDIVPFAGYLDDLVVVVGVLAYLDGKTE